MNKNTIEIVKDKILFKLLNEADPLLYGKPYKKELKGGPEDIESTQARLRSTDDDIEQAAAAFGMGTDLGFYSLVSMGNPFEVSFKLKNSKDIPKSWKGEETTIQDSKVSIYKALIWLDPDSFKKVSNNKIDKTTRPNEIMLNNLRLLSGIFVFI